jgi:hypothetical protein
MISKSQKLLVPLLYVLCLAGSPALAGRISQGLAGSGQFDCATALSGNEAWLQNGLSGVGEVKEWIAIKSCDPLNAILFGDWDLFFSGNTLEDIGFSKQAFATNGDLITITLPITVTLEVKDPGSEWGTLSTLGDPGGIPFLTSTDFSNGTTFTYNPPSGFTPSCCPDASFYTDHGALQFFSVTDAAGNVLESIGQETVPEPTSVWLPLAALMIIAGSRRYWRHRPIR